jgi:hypothetical protein
MKLWYGNCCSERKLRWASLTWATWDFNLTIPQLDALNDLEWFWMILNVQYIRFRQVLDAWTSGPGNRISRSGCPRCPSQSYHITKALAYVHSKGTWLAQLSLEVEYGFVWIKSTFMSNAD